MGKTLFTKCRLASYFSLLPIAQANLAANYRPDDIGRSRGHQPPHPPLRDCLQEAAVPQVQPSHRYSRPTGTATITSPTDTETRY